MWKTVKWWLQGVVIIVGSLLLFLAALAFMVGTLWQ